ncbi:unnamed protein product [Linum trigynum]|uniref:Uncharacterized protein n=1 Tax=Linum trigynum TaxID=586398 RepID=A0AAV2CTW5_9ROSI
MEGMNEGDTGEHGSRSGSSNQAESEHQLGQELSMEIEGEGSQGLPAMESESLSKRELFRVIADQDKAIAWLRRELEGGRSEDERTYSPTMRKRDKAVDDSESSQQRHPYCMGPSEEMTPPGANMHRGRLLSP